MIRKGILKSFDSSAYTASVQIVGSLSVWLDDVKVSEALAAVDMVAGRSIAVLFLDPSNPDDAVVIGLWGVAATFISDTAYNATSWNGVTNVAASKNAIRDKLEAGVTPSAHDLGGSEHNADTLADVNTKISDATLLKVDDATSDPLIDGNAAADGTEASVARKDHVHPKHHAKFTAAEARTACVEDAAYGAGWNGDTTHAPSQNAVYDKIESLILTGAMEGTVAQFQANAATGDFVWQPQSINDNNTAENAYADTAAQYAEVDYGIVVSLNQFRLFGNANMVADGDWKVQYYSLVTHAWVDWVTGITTRGTADWGSWDSSGGEVITNKIRLVATTIDTCNGGPDRNWCNEMEVKYA